MLELNVYCLLKTNRLKTSIMVNIGLGGGTLRLLQSNDNISVCEPIKACSETIIPIMFKVINVKSMLRRLLHSQSMAII